MVIDAINSMILGRKSRSQAATEQMNMIEDRLHEVAVQLTTQAAELEALRSKIGRIAKQHEEAKILAVEQHIALANQLNGTENKQLAAIDAHGGTLSTIGAIVQRLEQSLAATEGRLATVIGSVGNQLNLVENSQLSPIKSEIQEVSARVQQTLVALTASHAELSTATAGSANSVNGAENRMGALISERTAQLDTALAVARNAIERAVQATATQGGALLNTMNGLENRLAAAVVNQLAVAASTQVEHRAQLDAAVSAIDSRTGQLGNELNGLATVVNGIGNRLAAQLQVQAGAAQSLQNELAAAVNAIHNDLAAQQQQISGLTLQMETARSRDAALQMLTARGIAALVARGSSGPGAIPSPVVNPTVASTIAEQTISLRQAAPHNLDAWLKTFEAGTAESQRSAEGSLSHEGHLGAGYFRMFVNVHARGRILDAGCGQLALPSYLADWPTSQIAGFDPVPGPAGHPFPFAQTLAENIPWPAASFETVIVATSLDHIYCLDRALAEMRRVLVPGGRLLLWTAMFDHTTPYDPYGAPITPPDAYHLFHPGRNWFYALFEKHYCLIERLETVASAEFLAYRRLD
jgi:SAM-dependent methyltransferase